MGLAKGQPGWSQSAQTNFRETSAQSHFSSSPLTSSPSPPVALGTETRGKVDVI